MKNIIATLVILTCFLFVSNTLRAQEINTQNISYDDSVDESSRGQILDEINTLFTQYSTLGHVYTKNDGENFYALFATGAQLIDDFTYTVLSPAKMHPLDYTDRISNNYSNGIEYSISDVVLNKVGVDDDFNYIALLDFTKVINGHLSDGTISYDDGLTSLQKMKLSIDPYDLSNCRISSIGGRLDITSMDNNTPPVAEVEVEGTSDEIDDNTSDEIIEEESLTKVIQDDTEINIDVIEPPIDSIDQQMGGRGMRIYKLTENIFSIAVGGSFGSINTSNKNADATSESFANNLESTYRSRPMFDFSYRKSLGNKRKLFLYMNGGLELANITTDISSFSHSKQSEGIDIVGGISVGNTARSNNPPQSDNEQAQIRTGISEDASIFLFPSVDEGALVDGEESIDLFVVNAMIGMSYKLIKGAASKGSLFIDVGVGPSFLSGTSGNNVSYSGNITNGIKLPKSELFPREVVIDRLLTSNQNNSEFFDAEFAKEGDYKVEDKIAIGTALTGKTSSNLSIAGKLGLTYLYKLNYKYGISASVNYSTTLTSVLKPSYDKGSNFLEGSLNTNRDNSILEQYHENLGLSRIGIQVGLFFLIDKN